MMSKRPTDKMYLIVLFAALALGVSGPFGLIPFLATLTLSCITIVLYGVFVEAPPNEIKVFSSADVDTNDDDEEVDETWDFTPITPRVFLLSFGNYYDLAMHFLRYQEFYESPNPEFRNHVFSLVDFMDWYAKDRDYVFSYPDDWAGFNVPGWVFQEVLAEQAIKDWNKYDSFMKEIVERIQKQLPDDPWNFYIIGAKKGDDDTVDHELAHGLYSTVPEYRKQMDALTEEQDKLLSVFCEYLQKIGYDQSVFKDEFQAYFATGLTDDGKEHLQKAGCSYEHVTEKYETVFKTWQEKMGLKTE